MRSSASFRSRSCVAAWARARVRCSSSTGPRKRVSSGICEPHTGTGEWGNDLRVRSSRFPAPGSPVATAFLRRYVLSLFTLAAALFFSRLALAQTRVCDSLQGDKRQLATSMLQSLHPYACCDGTIFECLSKKPRCIVARRLADNVCDRVASGRDRADIERAIAKRAESMNRSSPPVPIDLDRSIAAGDPGAKVTVVAYVCARCPFCSKLVPSLYRQVVEGPLKGKARLYVKLFPIRTHSHSNEAAMGAMAAQELGKFWPFLLQLYAHFDDFDVAKLPDLAATVGIDRAAFVNLRSDATLRARLVDSKKEGIRNRVDATPTLFLDGFKYVGDLAMSELQDVIEEEYDRVSEKTTE